MAFHGPQDPVYTISVAARLLGVSPSFLRQIEGEGLLVPARTGSNIRLYSDEDLGLLSRVVYLCRTRGVNLQGVRVILAMEGGESQYPIAKRREVTEEVGGNLRDDPESPDQNDSESDRKENGSYLKIR